MIDKINKISSNTCTDIYTILIDLDLFCELPPDKQNFILKNRAEDYRFKFNSHIPLKYQIKSKETKIVLSYLFYKNEQKYQESLRKKYNPDSIFNNAQKASEPQNEDIEQKENLMMIVKKDTLFSQIIKKIRDFFKKNRD